MEFFDKLWEWAPEVFPFLIKASVVTLQVTAGSLALALVLGIFVAVARISSFKLLSYPALIYTDVMRGTPALVQLFIIYFGLSDLGLEFDPISAAIIGLGLNGAAYVGEIYRAGIVAIHRGQIEAALSLGMTPVRAMRYIILPQALVIVIPPMTSQVVNIIKNSAVAMTIAITDLMFYSQKIEEETFAGFEAYTSGTLLFLLLTLMTVGVIYGGQRMLGLKVRSAT